MIRFSNALSGLGTLALAIVPLIGVVGVAHHQAVLIAAGL